MKKMDSSISDGKHFLKRKIWKTQQKKKKKVFLRNLTDKFGWLESNFSQPFFFSSTPPSKSKIDNK